MKRLFHVEITKESGTEMWVLAESAAEAIAEAKEMTYDLDFEIDSTDYDADEVIQPHAGAAIWSGGEDGDWVSKGEAEAILEAAA